MKRLLSAPAITTATCGPPCCGWGWSSSPRRGINGFTLREVARRAGVSHAAPYHHFADRGALVRAIVAESYTELAVRARVVSRVRRSSIRWQRLQAMGEGYVGFALANPDRYRLMFRTELAGDDPEPDEVDRAGADAFRALGVGGRGGTRGGAPGRRCRRRHGVGRLLVDGPRRVVAAAGRRPRRPGRSTRARSPAGQPAGRGPAADDC